MAFYYIEISEVVKPILTKVAIGVVIAAIMITTTVVIAASVSYNDNEGVRLSPKGDNMKKLSVDPDNFLHEFNYGRVSTLPDGTTLREFTIFGEDVEVEVAPGIFFNAWTYNGTIPGPTIRVTEGDLVRIMFINNSEHPHTMHFHGIHQGDIFIKDGDVFGDDVNIASRIESFSPIGGISISDKVHKDISGVSDIKTSFIGHRKLKGVEQETKIRCITSDELPKHRKQMLPLIIGYYTMILGGLNAFLIFALIIYSAFIGFKLHYMWMCAFIINFTLIFIGYSCLSYIRGVSIKSQRLFVYLGYFIIILSILAALAMDQGFLFYLPPTETMLPF